MFYIVASREKEELQPAKWSGRHRRAFKYFYQYGKAFMECKYGWNEQNTHKKPKTIIKEPGNTEFPTFKKKEYGVFLERK